MIPDNVHKEKPKVSCDFFRCRQCGYVLAHTAGACAVLCPQCGYQMESISEGLAKDSESKQNPEETIREFLNRGIP